MSRDEEPISNKTVRFLTASRATLYARQCLAYRRSEAILPVDLLTDSVGSSCPEYVPVWGSSYVGVDYIDVSLVVHSYNGRTIGRHGFIESFARSSSNIPNLEN